MACERADRLSMAAMVSTMSVISAGAGVSLPAVDGRVLLPALLPQDGRGALRVGGSAALQRRRHGDPALLHRLGGRGGKSGALRALAGPVALCRYNYKTKCTDRFVPSELSLQYLRWLLHETSREKFKEYV